MTAGPSLRVPRPDGAMEGYAAPTPALLVQEVPDAHAEHLTGDGGLAGCLACGHSELYTRRAFPRALGILIVVVAAVLAPFTMYVSLFVAAGLDLLIYLIAPRVACCYVCGAEHAGFAPEPAHPRYDITIAERLKYGERAVMGSPMREGGTAGAPDPEH